MKLIDSKDLSCFAYTKIKEMILSGELEADKQIKQEPLAQTLGISRTPLQKAFKILEKENLVHNIPHRGIFVRKINIQEIIDVYECREAIETIASRRLAHIVSKEQVKKLKDLFVDFKGITPEDINPKKYQTAEYQFHRQLIEISGNKTITKLETSENIISKSYITNLIRPPKETLQEHLDMIKALEAGDANQAESIMRDHLQKSQIKLKTLLDEDVHFGHKN